VFDTLPSLPVSATGMRQLDQDEKIQQVVNGKGNKKRIKYYEGEAVVVVDDLADFRAVMKRRHAASINSY
jgi:hypothetical protein